MNIDHVLQTMNQCQVAYLLIGGMNYMLRYDTLLTFDIDLWIADTESNRLSCERALGALDAQWGESESTWQSVRNNPPGWISRQSVFSLNSPYGAIDILRSVPGLANWQASWQKSIAGQTPGGVAYRGICDEDMLRSNGVASSDLEPEWHLDALTQHSRNGVDESFSELVEREAAKRARRAAPRR